MSVVESEVQGGLIILFPTPMKSLTKILSSTSLKWSMDKLAIR